MSVEDGSAFCASCGAAQVRFSVPEYARGTVAVASSASKSTASSPDEPLLGSPVPRLASSSTPHDSLVMLRAAVYAGLIAAVLCVIPLSRNFVIALPFAGFLSVLFYRRWTRGPELQPGAGFKLGALTGAFGFVAVLVITATGTVVSHGQNEMREAMLAAVRMQQAHAADPQVRQMLDYFTTPQGMVFMMVFGFLIMGIVFVLLSGIGAAVSASLLRRKTPPDEQ